MRKAIHIQTVFAESSAEPASIEIAEGHVYLLTMLSGGDPQSAWWPLVDKVYEPYQSFDGSMCAGAHYHARATLAACLYDAVETGDIPYKHGEFDVMLPDGTLFDYLNECGEPYTSIEPKV